jgi:hypothetical protein
LLPAYYQHIRCLSPPAFPRLCPQRALGRFGPVKEFSLQAGFSYREYPRLEPRDADCAAKLKQHTLTNLYHERPAWLDLAHKQLDAARRRCLRLAG